MKSSENLLLFNATHSLIQADLKRVQDEFQVELGLDSADESGDDHYDDYYPQVTEAIRSEAAEMARHYEIFYCLENFLRELVATQLATSGEGWWDTLAPPAVKENVKKNIQKEAEAGVTQRSQDSIDYTTFGELAEIIQANWESFSDSFNNRKALSRILAGLNLLRSPIAHCSPLAEDEVVRLRLALKDFFRLME